jgi:beta-xylosidase
VDRDGAHRVRSALAAGALGLLPLPLPIVGTPPEQPTPAPVPATPPPSRDRTPTAHSFPDPSVLRVGGTYYAYGTGGSARTGVFPVLRSRDLVHWRRAGHAMRRPPRFSYKEWWAPSPLKRGKRYYLFYSAHARRPDKSCVAVATARKPAGPFRHRAVLTCDGTGGALDPAPLVTRRRVILYYARTDAYCLQFRSRCSLMAVSLRRDLLRRRGRARRVLRIDQPWEISPTYAIIENPWVVRRGRLYYLLYSANDWRAAYGMGYAVSRSPFGPFRKPRRTPFLHSSGSLLGPGGGSAFTDRAGELWLAFHSRRSGGIGGRRRSLHVERLRLGRARARIQGPLHQSTILP